MPKTHQVRPGDCISLLAEQHGFSVDGLWEHPDNAQLKAERNDPNVLAPGDRVVVPDKQTRVHSVKPGGTYRFTLTDTTVTLRLRLQIADEPIADAAYKLKINGTTHEGRSDGDGMLEQRISATAKSGKLLLVESGTQCELALGHLDPATQWSGVAQRLSNLGFYAEAIAGDPTHDPTPLLRRALKRFQQIESLPIDGELGVLVADALRKRHGS